MRQLTLATIKIKAVKNKDGFKIKSDIGLDSSFETGTPLYILVESLEKLITSIKEMPNYSEREKNQ